MKREPRRREVFSSRYAVFPSGSATANTSGVCSGSQPTMSSANRNAAIARLRGAGARDRAPGTAPKNVYAIVISKETRGGRHLMANQVNEIGASPPVRSKPTRSRSSRHRATNSSSPAQARAIARRNRPKGRGPLTLGDARPRARGAAPRTSCGCYRWSAPQHQTPGPRPLARAVNQK